VVGVFHPENPVRGTDDVARIVVVGRSDRVGSMQQGQHDGTGWRTLLRRG
jgi:hypothetical protein